MPPDYIQRTPDMLPHLGIAFSVWGFRFVFQVLGACSAVVDSLAGPLSAVQHRALGRIFDGGAMPLAA
jgi:hypothetical protein